jgi:hypothetical protein
MSLAKRKKERKRKKGKEGEKNKRQASQNNSALCMQARKQAKKHTPSTP